MLTYKNIQQKNKFKNVKSKNLNSNSIITPLYLQNITKMYLYN